MTDILNRFRNVLDETLETVKINAQSFRSTAEEYSKIGRLKFEIHQLNTSRKKKMELLGETLFPFLAENNISGISKHETLFILIDDIKRINNEIELTRNMLKDVYGKETVAEKDEQQQHLQEQINELEKEIESRLNEVRIVKEALTKK